MSGSTAFSRLMGGVVRLADMRYGRPPAHGDGGREPPTEENRGNTWKCTCGRLFASARSRSQHWHVANNRRRRMGI